MSILVISNPVSGDGKGREFVRDHVLPLLEVSHQTFQLEETSAAGKAGCLALNFLRGLRESHATIVVSGGDGTVHEVVNGISLSQAADHDPYNVRLVICPQGTANALYSTLFPPSNDEIFSTAYRLKSLRAFLNGTTSRLLTITQTQLITNAGQVADTILGVVVTSTALHACILDSAEQLRATVSGIERFKIAAAQHISKWYHSRVILRPTKPDGTVQVFDPRLKTFTPFGSAESVEVDLAGPYQYFLSTVNVDRLEPNFEVAPLFTILPPSPGEMDLIIIRPLRDPTIECETVENRETFVLKTSSVLQAVYNNGTHTFLRYAGDGTVHSDGHGHVIVEYIRCGGWEWEPTECDAEAHRVCVDGTIFQIGKGGKASCQVLTDPRGSQFTICA